MIDYLLSSEHPAGGAKARFFKQCGFRADEWETLRGSLGDHIRHNPVVHSEETIFGTKYVVEGTMFTPDQRDPNIRTVWFVRSGEHHLRFVTAYPLKG